MFSEMQGIRHLGEMDELSLKPTVFNIFRCFNFIPYVAIRF